MSTTDKVNNKNHTVKEGFSCKSRNRLSITLYRCFRLILLLVKIDRGPTLTLPVYLYTNITTDFIMEDFEQNLRQSIGL
jgi:hypothetical protein